MLAPHLKLGHLFSTHGVFMPTHFSMVNPAYQIHNLILQAGGSCPIRQIVREGVWNGADSNERFEFENPDSDTEKEIIIKKDRFNPLKVCITNIGGDYFSKNKAKQHLLTLANTDTNNKFVNNEFDKNKGGGAKYAYLPHAPVGILYRSKDVAGDGIRFHMGLQSSGYYGLKDFYCHDLEETTSFPYCAEFSHELENSHGTDMVLMGATEEQDTWTQLNKECSMGESKFGSGYGFWQFISNRLWDLPPSKIKIMIYNPDGSERSYQSCRPLKEQMLLRQINGTIELPETEGVLKGTKAHYCTTVGSDRGALYSWSSGFVGFAYKGEVYFDQDQHHTSRRSDLQNCGIYTKSTSWTVIFEIPSSLDLKTQMDRTSLLGIDKNSYFSSFANNLPDDIKNWLEEQVPVEVDVKDLNSWLKNKLANFKGFKGDFEGNKSGQTNTNKDGNDNSCGTGGGKSSKPPSNRGNTTSPKTRRRSGVSNLKNFNLPEIKLINDDISELARFDIDNSYTVFINEGHKIFKSRVDRLAKEFSHIPKNMIKSHVFKYTVKNVIYRIFEIQQYSEEGESLEDKEKRWKPEVLEACWTEDSNAIIRRVLNRKPKPSIAA